MPPPPIPRSRSLSPTIWILAALCALPELVLLGADWGLWGSARWRPMTYQYGAFWVGLLYDWRPNYAAQPVAMFASYGWLHAGPGHLLGNLGALVWLGPEIVARFGTRGVIALWAACLLGGAVGFALLTSSPAPMVGASGALFGLAGAWLVNEMRRMQSRRERLWRGMLGLVALLAINAVAWVFQGGQLAWETHLGGLLAGLVFATAWRGRKDVSVRLRRGFRPFPAASSKA